MGSDKSEYGKPENSIPYAIYQFTCRCTDGDISRTDWWLSQRISVYIFEWLKKVMLPNLPKDKCVEINPT